MIIALYVKSNFWERSSFKELRGFKFDLLKMFSYFDTKFMCTITKYSVNIIELAILLKYDTKPQLDYKLKQSPKISILPRLACNFKKENNS